MSTTAKLALLIPNPALNDATMPIVRDDTTSVSFTVPVVTTNGVRVRNLSDYGEVAFDYTTRERFTYDKGLADAAFRVMVMRSFHDNDEVIVETEFEWHQAYGLTLAQVARMSKIGRKLRAMRTRITKAEGPATDWRAILRRDCRILGITMAAQKQTRTDDYDSAEWRIGNIDLAIDALTDIINGLNQRLAKRKAA